MMSRKPLILFIINSLSGGGAERVMSRLLSLSAPYADEYSVALALLDKAEIVYPVPDWVTLYQLDCRGSFWASIRELRRLVRGLRPELRLSFLNRANVANCFAGDRRKVPWLISERINTSAHLGGGLRGLVIRALVRLTYPLATKIIAVSKGVSDELVRNYGVPEHKIEVVANPVDLASIRIDAAKFDSLALSEPFVFAMGRLTRSKNHALLLRAFAKAKLPSKLVIAGEGPERQSLERLAAKLGIADRVIYAGFLRNPYATMRHARVFALSSNVEGFPNALLEALAVGVPAVATNCPDGPAEILAGKRVEEIDGLTLTPAGVLVPCDDDDGFAKALQMLFDSPLRDKVIVGGEHRVEKYSPQQVVDRYWEIIKHALAS